MSEETVGILRLVYLILVALWGVTLVAYLVVNWLVSRESKRKKNYDHLDR